MKKLFLPYATLLILIITLFDSCKKNTQEVISSDVPQVLQTKLSIAEAKNWYSTSLGTGSISNAKIGTDRNKLGKFVPLWDKALNSEDDKYYVVESPVKFDTTIGYSVKTADKSPSVPINGTTKLLILKDKKTGEIISALMHIYSSTGSGAEQNNYGKRDGKFSGVIFFTDIDGNFINGWKYENGKITGQSKTSSSSPKNNNKEAPVCTTNTVSIYGHWCWYDEYGNASDCGPWEFLYSYSETTCSDYGGSGGGGGYVPPIKDCAGVPNGTAHFAIPCGCVGGTTGKPANCSSNQDIIDSLRGYPCAQEVLGTFTAKLSDSISSMIKSVFGINESLNLLYSVDPNLAGTTEDGYYNHINYIGGNAYYLISLNPTTLLNASKEYILATMIHEALHAYIRNKKNTLDSTTFNQEFPLYGTYKSNDPDHQLMATQFLNSFIKTLSGFNSNLDLSAARAICLAGLYGTDYWKTLSDSTSLKQKNLADRNVNDTTSYGHYKGTICTTNTQ